VPASSFYTAALEKPFVEALVSKGHKHRIPCVPYNQLYTFLLNPLSVVPELTELDDREHQEHNLRGH
jgi:hypothetical protein